MRSFKLFIVLVYFGLLGVNKTAQAAGLLTPKNQQLPALDLAEHHVNTVIDNGFVLTKVTQVFSNPHAQDLEAIYSFPIPEQAAVAELTVWIDGQPVVGEVVEKKRAKKIYQEQKSQGNDVGLTEQNGYKTFKTFVSPVRAGQETKIRLSYYQKVKVDHAIGRYVYPLEDGGVDEEAMHFWHSNNKVTRAFSFNLLLRSAYPIDAVRLPKHSQAQVKQLSPEEWQISLNKSKPQPSVDAVAQAMETQYLQANPEQEAVTTYQQQMTNTHQAVLSLNNDIVVYWRLEDNLPGSVDLITHRPDPKKPGTFMLTFTPGDDLQAIKEGIDWVFVLDRSGSMQGKYQSLLSGVSQALGKLRENDRYRIILFDTLARELTQGYIDVSPANVQNTITQLKQTRPGSSTNLYAALQMGIKDLDADRPSGIILVTDGVANVGKTEKKSFLNLLDQVDVRLFTFVMGNSANKPLLKALTKHSGGFAMNVSNSDDIVGRVIQASSKITHHAFHDAKLAISGINAYDLTPDAPGSLYRGEQLIVFGHYEGSGKADIQLTGKINGAKKVYATSINMPAQSNLHPELERLWAFGKIHDLGQQMQDFNFEDHRQAITDIALEYSIVTDYTSMLVVREEIKKQYNIGNRNKQRLAKEQAAQQKRKNQGVRSNRADTEKPMYTGRRSYGGGSFSWFWFIGLGLLGCFVRRPK